jgi:hypothetical protein
MTTVLTEQLHAGSFIVSEKDGFYSRDAVAVDASAPLAAGTVLGKKGIPADESAVVAAAAGNTGNGTLTLDATAPIAAAAQDGIYEVIFLSSTAYEVKAPDGTLVGEAAVGTTFAGSLKFVIAAGSTPFVAGDRFFITVDRPHPGADLYEPLNLLATDGTQIAAAILISRLSADETGVGTVKEKTVLSRLAEVRLADLTWPVGITAAQIAEAENQLRKVGIDCL